MSAQFSALTGAALLVPQLSFAENIGGGAPEPSLLHRPFTMPLPIPRVLEPVAQDDTTDYYEMTMRAGGENDRRRASRRRSGASRGSSPAQRSSPAAVGALSSGTRTRWTCLTTVHLHGGVVPSESDGMPTRPDPAGLTRANTSTPTRSRRRRSGTTIMRWTRPVCIATWVCAVSISSVTMSRTRCRCRRGSTTFRSRSLTGSFTPTARSLSGDHRTRHCSMARSATRFS